ncbi:serine phosphatase RsbU, regulator of sigma subunit [Thiovulum sp. ES]|nr:serine phosphatase RsbU, regulator of sigma subunit [Thiovulum sp. ES]
MKSLLAVAILLRKQENKKKLNNTIYIADDDKNLLNLYSSIFDSEEDELDFFSDEESSDEKFSIKLFEDGFFLVDEFKKIYEKGEEIPLVILDMRMPQMNGFETAKRVREIDKNTIVIIITAYHELSISEIRSELKTGIYYFKKPFNEDELYSLVDSALKQWNNFKELAELKNNLELKVEERTKELKKSKKLIEKAHQNIKDSINYASIIQKLILPNKTILSEYFSENFIFWKPKDIVGGDIYFIVELDSKEEVIVMVLDGAGHGVSGAFLTMLVKAIENQIVAEINSGFLEPSPAKILEEFNISLKTILEEGKSKIASIGFDGAVLYYNKSTNKCLFAGAKSDLIIVDKNGMCVINSDRKNVGFPRIKIDQKYTDQEIEVEKGIKMYLFTDGIVDQIGKNGKFGKSQLFSILSKKWSLDEVGEKVERAFFKHKSDFEQNDDVTILGIEF